MSSADSTAPAATVVNQAAYATAPGQPQPSYPGLVQESIERAVIRNALSWAFGQNPVVVIGVMLLSFGGYGLYYAVNVLVPAHLQSIQEGYERIQQSYVKDRETSEAAHREQYERLALHWTQIATEIRAVVDNQNHLIRELVLKERGQKGTGNSGTPAGSPVRPE